MVDTNRRRFLALGGVAALTSLSGCSGVTPFVGKRLEETRTYTYEPGSSVAVTTTNGDVTFRPGDGGQIRVETVKKASSVFADLSDVTVDVTRNGDTIDVRVNRTGDGSLLGGTPSVDVTVELPEGVTVGDARTENGGVDVRDVAGDATLATGNGDVVARNVDGFLAVETKNGDATVRNVAGIDGAKSTNGDVKLDVPAIRGDTLVETVNGDVEARVSPSVGAHLVLESDFGDVELRGLDANVRTKTERRIEGRLGTGGRELRFAAQTGDVELGRLD